MGVGKGTSVRVHLLVTFTAEGQTADVVVTDGVDKGVRRAPAATLCSAAYVALPGVSLDIPDTPEAAWDRRAKNKFR
jgi:hypothetical protein